MAHIRPVSLIPRISPTAGLGRWRIFSASYVKRGAS